MSANDIVIDRSVTTLTDCTCPTSVNGAPSIVMDEPSAIRRLISAVRLARETSLSQ